MTTNEPGALSDLIVLELGDEGTQFCGKLLADMGARVIKVEPPGGAGSRHRGPYKDDKPDPNTSLYFWAYNTSKESVTLDLDDAKDRDTLRAAARRADVVLEDYAPGYLSGLGLGYEDLAAVNPRLIVASVTPFGQTGPRKDWQGCDLVHMATGGPMWLIGYDDPETPPLLPQGDISFQMGGYWAAIGIFVALWQQSRTGEGQHVDVSNQEACAFGVDGYDTGPFEYMGVVSRRRDYSGGTVQCQDGRYIIPQMLNITPERWGKFVEWLKDEKEGEELYDDKYYDPAVLEKALPVVQQVVQRIASSRSADEMWELGQSLGFTWMVFNAPEELFHDPQLQFRNFFQSVEHPELGASYLYAGPPYQWSEATWAIRRRPPLLGEDNDKLADLLA